MMAIPQIAMHHTVTKYTNADTLSVVGVERSMSKTVRLTSIGRKIGAWCIFNAPKVRPAGLSPQLGCFRAKAAKEANGEARRAEPMVWLR